MANEQKELRALELLRKKESGYSPKEARALELLEKKYAQQEEETSQEPEPESKKSYGENLAKSFFPETIRAGEELAQSKDAYVKRATIGAGKLALGALGDIATFPNRTLGGLMGQDPSDPKTRPGREGFAALKEKGIAGQATASVLETITDPMSFVGLGIGKSVMKAAGSKEAKLADELTKNIKQTKPSKPVVENENGSIVPEEKITTGEHVVDDIEAVVEKTEKADAGISRSTFNDISKRTKPEFKPEKRLGVIPTGMDEIEAFALAIPEEKGTIPFTAFAEQAIKAKPRIGLSGQPVPTALDAVGAREIEAMKRLDSVISGVGKAKGELIQEATKTAQKAPWGETIGLVDTQPVKIAMENTVQKILGASVGRGTMQGLPGRISSDVNKEAIDEMAGIINQLPRAATVQQVDDAVRRLFELKQTMEGGVSTRFAKSPDSQRTVVNQVRDELKKTLDTHIGNVLSPEDSQRYRKLNTSYANLIKNRDYAQRRIGALVGDIDDQQLARGAGVARAAVANNSDMGTKAMFSFLKKYTGIDLYRESMYAWLATKAVGDDRGISLVEGAIRGSGALKGTAGSVVNAGTAAMKMVQGNKLKTLVNYYNKMQNRVEHGKTGAKNILGNQRGSIGSDDFIAAAIRDPETGKIYKGDWRGHKGALNTADSESTRNRLQRELFKDNTSTTPNVGFIDKKGNFVSRSDAEKMMELKYSGLNSFRGSGAVPLMTFGSLGAGGTLAGATAYQASRNKQKKLKDLENK